MATMKSKVKHIYDAASEANFRSRTAAAVTATGQSAGIDLNALNLAYWDNGEIPARELDVAIVVTAVDFTSADETYTISVEVATDSAFTSPVQVAATSVLGIGAYTLCVDMDSVRTLGAHKYMRVKHTVGGTTPSITYTAWLAEYGG